MNPPIKVEKDLIKFSVDNLQLEEVLVWVGHGFDPLDNDDKRVSETRDLMKKYYNHIPYGMYIGNKQEDGSFKPAKDENKDGYYDLDVSWWPEGSYRLNFHSLPGVQSPVGTKLDETKRDQDVSWPLFWKDWSKEVKVLAKPFIHKDLNNAGYNFRILIKPDRTIEAFGDLDIVY